MPEDITSTNEVTEAQSAFRGLNAYREEDQGIFFGRDEEIRELYRLVKSNTLTTVFGKSGTGKTSLLNAGVFPKLKEDDCLPFRVRLEFDDNAPGLIDQVMAVIRKQIDRYGFKIGTAVAGESLWEFFHRESLWKIVTPVLVFDQFEEIFTLAAKFPSKKQELDVLLTELSDLIENTIPQKLKDKYLAANKKIDFNYTTQPVKVIIAFREDFLPEMESITKEIPSVKHSRFRLKQMNGRQAFDVITKTWKAAIDKAEAQKIVYYLTNETDSGSVETESAYGKFELLDIEPSLLNQVCAYLDKERQNEHLDKISTDFLSRYPKGKILSSIYHQAVNEGNSVLSTGDGVPARNLVQEFLEDKLITEEGYRTKYQTEEISPDIMPGVIVLRQKYFIREEGGTVELTHDVIATLVKSDRDQRRTKLAVQAADKRAKRKAVRIIVIALSVGLVAWAGSGIWSFTKINAANKAAIKTIDSAEKVAEKKIDDAKRQQGADSAKLKSLPISKDNNTSDIAWDSLQRERTRLLDELARAKETRDKATTELENIQQQANLYSGKRMSLPRLPIDSYSSPSASHKQYYSSSYTSSQNASSIRSEDVERFEGHINNLIQYKSDASLPSSLSEDIGAIAAIKNSFPANLEIYKQRCVPYINSMMSRYIKDNSIPRVMREYINVLGVNYYGYKGRLCDVCQ